MKTHILFFLSIFIQEILLAQIPINLEAINLPKSIPYTWSYLETMDSSIYVGTESSGVFKSTDQGLTWQLRNSGINCTRVMALKENSKGWLYAGIYGSLSPSANNIYRTKNGGLTWEKIHNNGSPVYSIEIDSRDYIYAGVYYMGILFSTNDGNTWTLKNQGLENLEVRHIYIHSDSLIFAATSNGIYKSTNEGEQWNKINEGIEPWGTSYIVYQISCLNDTLYITSKTGFYYSSNFGDTWVKKLNINNLGQALTFFYDNKYNFYLNPDKKIIKSTDRGSTWDTILSSSSIHNYKLVVKNNRILVTVANEGILSSTDFGNTWNSFFRVPFVPEKINSFLINQADSCWYAACSNGIYISSDRGTEWERIDSAFEAIDVFIDRNRVLWVSSTTDVFIKSATDSCLVQLELPAGTWFDCIFFENDTIFLSSRYGHFYKYDEEWKLVTVFPTSSSVRLSNLFIYKNSIFVYRVTFSLPHTFHMHTLRSNDYFNSWAIFYNGRSVFEFNNDYIFMGNSSGMFRTPNIEQPFYQINNGLTQLGVSKIKVINDKVFAKTSGKFFISFNNGDYWHQILFTIPGYSSPDVTFIEEFEDKMILLIEGMLFKSSIIVQKIDDHNKSFYSLSQNYPNPFNPSTKIRYAVSNTQKVVIKIFDILGNEIATLVNEEKIPGEYEIEFSAGSFGDAAKYNLSSGVYFYQLRMGSFIQTKKMILVR